MTGRAAEKQAPQKEEEHVQSGYVWKSATAQGTAQKDLDKINTYTRRRFTEEEVYTFQLVLCDNDVDRDGERFATQALYELAPLFVGKTGIFNHSIDAAAQSARIYEAAAQAVPGKTTATGEPYVRLMASAYMPRTAGNKDLILEIDSGIKKEVSVGCAMGSATCSICGADLRGHACGHRLGERYDGKLCCKVLGQPRDAYEWSFVAVPAQRQAGVTKRFAAGGAQGEWGERYRKRLLEETVKYFGIACPGLSRETARRMAEELAPEELEGLEGCLRKAAGKRVPLTPQLAVQRGQRGVEDGFSI